MQVGNTIGVARPASGSALPPTWVIVGSLAQSTQLSLDEKRDFANAILKAAGNPTLLKKLMLMIAQLESQRAPGTYAANTVEEVMKGLGDGSSQKAGLYA